MSERYFSKALAAVAAALTLGTAEAQNVTVSGELRTAQTNRADNTVNSKGVAFRK